MIRDDLKKIIKKSLEKEGFKIEDFQILKPREKKHGDYSLNVAFEVAEKSPMEVAEELKKRLEREKLIERIEILEPGFINLFLNRKVFEKGINEILKKRELYPVLKMGRNKKVQVEFISANPTGPLTIGNARGGPFGDTLSNVLKQAGYEVSRAYYVNDYGNQIMALGHSVLKDDTAKYKGEYIDFLHNRVSEKDPYLVGKWAGKIILEEMIKATVQKLKINYDEWFSETWLYENKRVDKVLEFLKKEELTYVSEGAVFFKAKQFGDIRDRVLVKKDGKATYLLGDIAYHEYKFKDKKFDKVINIWGSDHAGDVKGLLAGVEALSYKGKLETILLQFVTVKKDGEKVRMSKREGTYITMDDLLNDVPVDVIRFFFLEKSFNTHLNFDLDLALDESDKNPVYYIKYAYARICSVLENAKIDVSSIKKAKHFKFLKEDAEINLLKELLRFEEVIEDTACDYEVHRLPKYALDLASYFHKFYSDHKILDENKRIRQARIELIVAVKIVLHNLLKIMGISAPSKM